MFLRKKKSLTSNPEVASSPKQPVLLRARGILVRIGRTVRELFFPPVDWGRLSKRYKALYIIKNLVYLMTVLSLLVGLVFAYSSNTILWDNTKLFESDPTGFAVPDGSSGYPSGYVHLDGNPYPVNEYAYVFRSTGPHYNVDSGLLLVPFRMAVYVPAYLAILFGTVELACSYKIGILSKTSDVVYNRNDRLRFRLVLVLVVWLALLSLLPLL